MTQEDRRRSIWHLVSEVEPSSEKELSPSTVQTLSKLFSMSLEEQGRMAVENATVPQRHRWNERPQNLKFLHYVPKSTASNNNSANSVSSSSGSSGSGSSHATHYNATRITMSSSSISLSSSSVSSLSLTSGGDNNSPTTSGSQTKRQRRFMPIQDSTDGDGNEENNHNGHNHGNQRKRARMSPPQPHFSHS